MVPQCCYFLTCTRFSPFCPITPLPAPTPPLTPHSRTVSLWRTAGIRANEIDPEKRSHRLNNHKGAFKNSPISLRLSWSYEHKEREVVGREVEGRGGREVHIFRNRAVFKMRRKKKKLLSSLSALLKLTLALCMVLYLLKFISPSFLLPKLKSPNKDLSKKKRERELLQTFCKGTT